jgi:hypothetical protein
MTIGKDKERYHQKLTDRRPGDTRGRPYTGDRQVDK